MIERFGCPRKAVLLILIAAFLLMLAAPAAAGPAVQEAYVIRTVDGDTLLARFDGREYRIRMVGVDTPETHHPSKPVGFFGPEAEKFTRDSLTGATVYLEFDVQQRDKYGRLLAYVWLEAPREGSEEEIRAKMFNARLLLDGYAKLLTIPPNVRYVDYFRVYQREAADSGRGLWAR